MYQKQMVKQMIEFNQSTFNNVFNAVALMQDQAEQVAKSALNQAEWMPADGRRIIENWVDACKMGRDNFKKYVDESYVKAEEMFSK